MKINNSILWMLSLSLLLCFSCEDLLEENPESFIGADQFFKTEEDALSAVYAMYSDLTDDHSRNMYILNSYTTDEGTGSPGSINALEQYTFDSTQGTVADFWKDHYKLISNANVILEEIGSIDMDDTLKNSFLGEARFMRALAYFRLVQFFGDIPLVLSATKSIEGINVERSSASSIYDQIIVDLSFAEQNLLSQDKTEIGRPSNIAATGLLAKVYLTMENWELSAKKSKEVIDSGLFGLMDNFSEVFKPETQVNKENIFVLNFKSGLPGDQQFELKYYLPRDLPGARGLSRYHPTEHIYNSFDDQDSRKDWTFFTSYTYQGETYTFTPHWHKFMDYATLSNTDDNDTDVPLLRYADILLIYAEALNESNGPVDQAYEAVNLVRRRAYQVTDASYDLKGLSKESFRAAVWKERKLEFAGEWHRWFDLKRTNRLLSIKSEMLGRTVPERYQFLPIPQRERDANPNLGQNLDY
ncbi:RagB/SusD family nutrient uptake outer membrane protein [Algibacter pacificus]|uniref:RagB/SusD family nutrient uptake outer membrane protein n=1 Tax=Algibacter pacificus TaxID=2599389 RepID=UPI0011CB353A|nr:RagB/SusD family nutrient uptake outer membrane protein [Algibacter pacificus]